MKYFHFTALWQEGGWLSPAYVGVDSKGSITYLSNTAPKESVALEPVAGLALPGFQNSHSHAFQYAMAGMAEKHEPGSSDDFWSWREAMYQCALTMDPDQMEAVATMLYSEMLRHGYTSVAEFHYLHHDKKGKPYANLAEMGERLVAAAKTAGIKITLIPVFYQKGGFNKEPFPRQIRFISRTVDDYFQLLDDTAHLVSSSDHARLGISVHSLRAVDEKDILKTVQQGPQQIPFHLHAAEQLKEVDDCVEHWRKRPVEWILENLPLNERFHLVHCTHLNDAEVKGLAESKANVVLCPGTEGNLGDGIFRLSDFARLGGHWSIGTDSHISLNPLEDLRWLDYAQRLITHKRNTFDDGASVLIQKVLQSGRRAMGFAADKNFEIGKPFDAVIYNSKSPLITRSAQNYWLPSIVYAGGAAEVYGTVVNGQWVIQNQEHANAHRIRSEFRTVINQITS